MEDSSNVLFEESNSIKNKEKRKLKLSLNSNIVKLSKPKELTAQTTLVSFFQKKSNGLDSDKDPKMCEGQKKGKKKKKHKETGLQTQHCDLDLDDRKVRFSNDIVEISPEPAKKQPISDDDENCVKKINAFTFMMDSRNKSIGQNSPGKEIKHGEDSVEIVSENKKKLLTRKLLFEEWADRKGAKKRKMEYVEKGFIIEEKLSTRAKRLKKLLNVNKEDLDVVKPKASRLSLKKSKQENGSRYDALPQQTKWKMKLKVVLDHTDEESDDVIDLRGKSRKCKKAIQVSSDSGSDDGIKMLSSDERVMPKKDLLKQQGNDNVNLAPLFTVAQRKKADKVVAEARKQFLHSSMPDSVKKVVEKQQKQETPDYVVFPMVSHIRVQPHEYQFVNSSPSNLCFTPLDSRIPQIGTLTKGCATNLNDAAPMSAKDLKARHPDYPIYRTFKALYTKHLASRTAEPASAKKSKKSRSKRKDAKCNSRTQTWTEVYRPVRSDDILGNGAAIEKLKAWLQLWLEVNWTTRVSNRRGSNSSSDFEGEDDEDSRNDCSSLESTYIFVGPCGSGKTAAVYAVCNELDVNVLEINASSKRTGKKLLVDLQEATQSYQVRKQSALSTFVKSNLISDDTGKLGKMCLLLIEDVDLVFEQDDGFLSALSQLVDTSKRPIVLTTTDTSCPHLRKFPVVTFSPLLPRMLTPWLQLLCLVEGALVAEDSVTDLLEHNRGDVRKTILQLQFLVESGREFTPHVDGIDEILREDDSSNLKHTKQDFQQLQFFNDSPVIDLDHTWWSTHNILGIAPPTRRAEREITESTHDVTTISDFFDTLALTDVVYAKFNLNDCNIGLVNQTTHKTIGDSLELNESGELYTSKDACCEWLKVLLNAYTKNAERLHANGSAAEKRRQKKLSMCKENLLDVVPQVIQLQSNAVSLDYFATLRTICRSEIVRAGHSNKRKSRFYNYLRGLGLQCNENYFQIMSNIFQSGK
ncbi:ATPase family AAA domain-containing protein 5 isoform X2 [Photinus pyralis]|uniref:ATPase family AAA domain-containing protein 5 isoform X2 n=1 Tax=Photinus pyralis TaxID=7054 RepID=UPI001266F103|nr:ATPase family AAA domain-containing protein 5 isoform X2 [Photinus pyralis]